MKLYDYKNEIVAIATEHKVAWDIAKDMFLANIRNAGTVGLPYYGGADNIDYAALKEHYEELEASNEEFNAKMREDLGIQECIEATPVVEGEVVDTESVE